MEKIEENLSFFLFFIRTVGHIKQYFVSPIPLLNRNGYKDRLRHQVPSGARQSRQPPFLMSRDLFEHSTGLRSRERYSRGRRHLLTNPTLSRNDDKGRCDLRWSLPPWDTTTFTVGKDLECPRRLQSWKPKKVPCLMP